MIAVALGGAIGSLLRYSVSLWFLKYAQYAFPYSTFTVNIFGSFLIGLVYALAEKHEWLSAEWRVFMITGLCGGLTTFSSFAFENIKLLQEGSPVLFFTYTLASVSFGLLAVIAGLNLVKLF